MMPIMIISMGIMFIIMMMNVYRDVDYHDLAYGYDECDHVDYSVLDIQ